MAGEHSSWLSLFYTPALSSLPQAGSRLLLPPSLVPLLGCSLRSPTPSCQPLAEPQLCSREQTCTPGQGLAASEPCPSCCHPAHTRIALPLTICTYAFRVTCSVRLPCAPAALASLSEVWVYPTPLDGAAKHTGSKTSARTARPVWPSLALLSHSPSNSISWLERPLQKKL